MSPRVFIGAVAVAFAIAALVLFIASVVSASRARRARERSASASPSLPPPLPSNDGSDLDLSGLQVPAHTDAPPDPSAASVLDRIEWWAPSPSPEDGLADSRPAVPWHPVSADPVTPVPVASVREGGAAGPPVAYETDVSAAQPVEPAPGDDVVPVPEATSAPAASRCSDSQSDDLTAILAALTVPPAADAGAERSPDSAALTQATARATVPQVELVLDGKRVTVRAGSPTHVDFKRYADALLADLRDCRGT